MTENDDLGRLRTALLELQTINRVIDRICRVRELNHVMSIVVDELINYTGASQGIISLVGRTTEEELVTVVRHHPAAGDELPYRVSQLVSGWVLREKRALRIDDLSHDDRFPGLAAEDDRYHSILCCPMIARDEPIGITTLLRNAKAGPFTEGHARLAGIIASQSAQIMSNARLINDLAQNNELLEIARQRLQDENVRLRSALDRTFSFENLIGDSPKMREVLALGSRAAGTDAPVLVAGPTGTGKELMARAIHCNSARRERPFVIKNCGIRTESLLESELFGHARGAFTGADRDKPGLFQEADGGTIFLDEIGDAPLSTQAAILRVLETGEIRPVGGTKTSYVDVRVISATNKDLAKEIEEGQFRRDLYYRLNTFKIEMPSLAARRSDIPALVQFFLHRLRTRLGLETLAVSGEALDLLMNHTWPGNIRQLEHELERAAVLSDPSGLIQPSHLSPDVVSESGEAGPEPGTLREAVERLEMEMIRRTLDDTDGNIMRSSQILGLTRKGLKDKIARYGLRSGDEQ